MLQEMSKRRKLDEELSEPVVDRESVINQEIANIKPITRWSLNFLSTYLQANLPSSRDMQVIQTFTEDPWIDDEDRKTAGWFYPYQDALSKCRMFTFKVISVKMFVF